jgi:hypothetical protein
MLYPYNLCSVKNKIALYVHTVNAHVCAAMESIPVLFEIEETNLVIRVKSVQKVRSLCPTRAVRPNRQNTEVELVKSFGC